MRVFHFQDRQVSETGVLPTTLPPHGFVWVSMGREEFEQQQMAVQDGLQHLCGTALVDLHVSDLLNAQLPSHYDYTAQYDVLVFRRLAQGRADATAQPPASTPTGKRGQAVKSNKPRGGPPVLRRIDTSPVGFALFDELLLTVHPNDCAARDSYIERLLALAASEHVEVAEPGRSAPVRFMPSSPADLMLRLVSHMVDGYLELRRELNRQLDHWQVELLSPHTRFGNWGRLLEARMTLHQLDEICEDQRVAVQDWIATLNDWPLASEAQAQREREQLKVRSRDVLEHIERVLHHVRRLEQTAETAVQMHFSAQGHRANEIMRTLTVLTAIFLPLNLIAGIFGMNFEFIPLLHRQGGFWWAMVGMGLIAVGLSGYFWRKRYLDHD